MCADAARGKAEERRKVVDASIDVEASRQPAEAGSGTQPVKPGSAALTSKQAPVAAGTPLAENRGILPWLPKARGSWRD